MTSVAHRKVVTVLFCDVVGSTALGESVDPEALQGLLARYFERMKGIVESHGGSVEKFIGDAVMAVFGVPVAHEDDALRACRAAVEMREAFPGLGVEGRIGVNTGEVLAGTEERLATGDAVNVAARLEQAAHPGEILVGEATLELVRGASEVESVQPLVLKGKSQPVPAFRFLAVREVERGHEMRFVGRDTEVALIQAAWERAVAEQSCELVTIVGDPGIGKSRLVAEALIRIGARVMRGRCLSYGEGITYWPVVEVLKQLDALPSDPAAVASIRALLGENELATSADEIAWAFRKLLEEQAPLVVVFDDIQWGEETFFDLVEGVALLSSRASILLLCITRPELHDRRAQWPFTLRLEPLPEDAVGKFLADAPQKLRPRIAAAAAGNPLFLTEMVAMASEASDVEVPATLRALLTARLDQLDSRERAVLERGSVEGELFHRGAVQALAPEETEITPRLAALVRRDLIRPDLPQFPREDAYRFRHLLIRDTAYDALPKATRAGLHRRFAAWLEEHGPSLVELDEILGYHLEQAALYLAELGQPDPALAERAGAYLAAAGRRALSREDKRAAAPLLRRAFDLTRVQRLDVQLELELARAHQPAQAAAIAEAAATRAGSAGDEAGQAFAQVVAAEYRMDLGAAGPDEVEALARAALPLLEQTGDHTALARVWYTLGVGVANPRGDFEGWTLAAEQALRHARLTGPTRDLMGLDGALRNGPRPADEALRILDELVTVPDLHSATNRAVLLAMIGRFDEAWPVALAANERRRELVGYGFEWALGEIAALAGDHEAAVRYHRIHCDGLDERGLSAYLSTSAPRLGRELCALGRYDEAEPLAQLGRELGDEQDVTTQFTWRQVQGLVLAHRGEHVEAERLVREAVAIAEQTDSPLFQGEALADLAEVLHAAGQDEEAAVALTEALDCYERKGIVPLARRVRERLAALEPA